jgi:hypothetical protein
VKSKAKTNPPPPPRSKDPFEIHIRQERTQSGNGAVIGAEIKLRIRDEANAGNLLATVTIRASVLANDNLTVDERIPIESIEVDPATGEIDLPNARLALTLTKEEPVTVNIQSVPFEADWVASLAVAVESSGFTWESSS